MAELALRSLPPPERKHHIVSDPVLHHRLRPHVAAEITSDRPFRRLERLGQREGFPVVSLLALFRERAAADGPLFRHDDIHHTPAGARLLAEGVEAGLFAHGLLPRCPSPR